jgi:hypothetical protein
MEELADTLCLVLSEVVLFPQYVGQLPMAQPMYVSQLSLSIEDFLRPFAGYAQRFGEGPEELDDLGDVIVVLAVLRARLRIEQVITSNQLKDLQHTTWSVFTALQNTKVLEGAELVLTIAAMLQTSVLAPHFAPKITSGDRYCRVCMSLVK